MGQSSLLTTAYDFGSKPILGIDYRTPGGAGGMDSFSETRQLWNRDSLQAVEEWPLPLHEGDSTCDNVGSTLVLNKPAHLI